MKKDILKEPKNSPIVIWVNKIEKELVKDKAKKENRSVSNFCKNKIGVYDNE